MKRVFPTTLQSGASQSGSFVLMLFEPISARQIPIIIGPHEAHAILLARQSTSARRPLTHEVMLQVMDAYHLSLLRVSIDRVLEGIFYASLHIIGGTEEQIIDCRTTDAVVLALRAGVPIMVEEAVLEEAGVPIKTEESEGGQQPSIEELQRELEQCLEREDYERADVIWHQIKKLKE